MQNTYPKKCTGATLNQDTNEMDPCQELATFQAMQADEEGTYQWRGNYCATHAQDANHSWEYWTITQEENHTP
jgi:hypothetical protein